MFFNLCWICSKKTSVSSFYKENNFKPCLNKQLLNMFKLWCERGISPLSQFYSQQVPLTKRVRWLTRRSRQCGKQCLMLAEKRTVLLEVSRIIITLCFIQVVFVVSGYMMFLDWTDFHVLTSLLLFHVSLVTITWSTVARKTCLSPVHRLYSYLQTEN